MLKELTEKIRKAIPRLMELEDGCIIKYDGDKYVVGKDCEKDNIVHIYIFKLDMVIFSDEYDIIGHEPMLNDVLEWLGEDYAINGNSSILKWDESEEEYRYIKIDWNLTKPYLKDQSKELIEKLNNL